MKTIILKLSLKISTILRVWTKICMHMHINSQHDPMTCTVQLMVCNLLCCFKFEVQMKSRVLT